jgi:delta(3,5)-delta(2,4)-dienoyl-CoA isomerase
MRLEIRAIFDSLSTAPEVRAVVFSGAGPRAFTTGLDVQAANQTGPLANGEVAAVDVARKATAVRRHIIDFQDCISSLEKCEKRGFDVWFFFGGKWLMSIYSGHYGHAWLFVWSSY